jgi:two-component system sensor histidine kinase KdpD
MAENPNIVRERGTLKIFLGFAPGVGKTYAMLDEGRRRKGRGQDVVAAFIDPHGRQPIVENASDFEVIERKVVDGASEMDTDAVIARRPEVALVDDLAHVNAHGSHRAHRWQDVEALLDAGINVIATVNVAHLESLNDQIADITGHKVKDTLPDKVLRGASEVELVDLTPRALINRLQRGDIYASDQVEEFKPDFFREGNLMALREIAMREVASRVDEDVVEYRKEKRIEKPWATKDKVMVCISSTRTSLRLLRRGFRMGQRMHGEVIAVHVEDGTSSSDKALQILQEDFALAERLGIQTVTLKGPLGPTLVKFAKDQNVTAVILGHPERSRLQEVMKASVLSELARELRTVDIIVVATEVSSDAGAGH